MSGARRAGRARRGFNAETAEIAEVSNPLCVLRGLCVEIGGGGLCRLRGLTKGCLLWNAKRNSPRSFERGSCDGRLKPVGHYFEGTRASCALGAAYEGMYRLPSETGPANPSRDLEWFFACLDNVKRCPAENCKKKLSLAALIVHLNDDHRWSREQIADWVSGQQIGSPERAIPGRAAE